MIGIFDPFRDLRLLNIVIRMALCVLLGGLIGLERSYKNRSAGFRTHILVTIGAALASMIGLYLYLNAHMDADVSRIGSAVVSGLGFIGAGTIVVTKKSKVTGLTTAAGLWASGIIGLGIGAGFYEGAVICTALVLISQTVFSVAEQQIRTTPEFEITISYQDKEAIDQAMRYCKDHRLSIVNLRVTGDGTVYRAILTLRPRRSVNTEKLLEHISNIPGVIEMTKIDV